MANRASQKRISREAIVLRHMRHKRKLSLNDAGRRMGITGSAVAHIEHGRMDISDDRLKIMVEAYSYSMQEFMELVDGNETLINLRDECLSIVRQLDETKLAAAHGVLTHLLPHGITRSASNPKLTVGRKSGTL